MLSIQLEVRKILRTKRGAVLVLAVDGTTLRFSLPVTVEDADAAKVGQRLTLAAAADAPERAAKK